MSHQALSHDRKKITEGSNKMQMRSCEGHWTDSGWIMRTNTIKDSEEMTLKTCFHVNENFSDKGAKLYVEKRLITELTSELENFTHSLQRLLETLKLLWMNISILKC